MASEVSICNLALSHLGDEATVSSIDPPEGSAQASHCAQFYPDARDSLLEMHDWKFATTRVMLSEVDVESWNWEYAYAVPSEMIRACSVLPATAADDSESADYIIQAQEDGEVVILSNLESASLVYVKRVTDPAKFSPLFNSTLSWYLASMLAGPVLKGEVGQAESKRCLQQMVAFLDRAQTSNANQRKVTSTYVPGSIAAR